jgi:hypothetical protein
VSAVGKKRAKRNAALRALALGATVVITLTLMLLVVSLLMTPSSCASPEPMTLWKLIPLAVVGGLWLIFRTLSEVL